MGCIDQLWGRRSAAEVWRIVVDAARAVMALARGRGSVAGCGQDAVYPVALSLWPALASGYCVSDSKLQLSHVGL